MEDDDENETEQDELSLGDKLFLSLFAFVQELRIDSLNANEARQRQSCKIRENGNFLESLLMIFVNDRLDSELFIYKLDNLTSRLFELYMT